MLLQDERRLQFLRAAQEVFVVNVYHEASIDDIARTAHLSKPVLCQHFPSKRELCMELFDINFSTLADALNDALRSTNHEERVHDAIRAYYGYIARDDDSYRLVFECGLTNAPDVRSRLEGLCRRNRPDHQRGGSNADYPSGTAG